VESYQQLHQYISQFVPLSNAELQQLASLVEKRQYKKKELLIKAGDVANMLYFISKGCLREYFIQNRQQITTDIILEETISGSVSSFFTGMPSLYNLEAMEPVTVLCISKNDLEKLYESDVKWERFGRIITADFLVRQEQEILNRLQYTPRELFEYFFENNYELLQRAPQKYLASYLAIKPETFSRLKKAYQKKMSLLSKIKRG
jgi:CRP-like cAMP-binding protein